MKAHVASFFPSRRAASCWRSSTCTCWAVTTSGCFVRGSTCTRWSSWRCSQKSNTSCGITCWDGVSKLSCKYLITCLNLNLVNAVIGLCRFSTRASGATFDSAPMLLQRQVSILDFQDITLLKSHVFYTVWWGDLIHVFIDVGSAQIQPCCTLSMVPSALRWW